MSAVIERVRRREADRMKRVRQEASRAAWIAEGERMERAIQRQIFAIEEKRRNKKWWQLWL